MQQGRGGIGSRKHGRGGHATQSPRFRLWARLEAERTPKQPRPKSNFSARSTSCSPERNRAEAPASYAFSLPRSALLLELSYCCPATIFLDPTTDTDIISATILGPPR